jgi:hypothetical protein
MRATYDEGVGALVRTRRPRRGADPLKVKNLPVDP